MKIVIIGGVAGGMSAATRLRRLNENAEILIVEKGPYVSFANCGLPYHISGEIKKRDNLLVQTPKSLKKRFNIDVLVNTEAIKINSEKKEVTLNCNGEKTIRSYDKLILAPGAKSFVPPIANLDKADNVFTLRNIPDMDKIIDFINSNNCKNATVIGAGFIGLEMVEALHHKGLNITIVEKAPHILPPLDTEMASLIYEELEKNNVQVLTNTSVIGMSQKGHLLELEDHSTIESDLTLLAVGVTPETALAKDSHIETGLKGGILVNECFETSIKDIYAVGDAIILKQTISKQDSLIALASPANRQGRLVADIISGIHRKNRDGLGTSILKIFNQCAGMTGLNERQLDGLNLDYEVLHIAGKSHAGYYPRNHPLLLKLLFNKNTGEIYGAQGVGKEGIDKRIDIISTAIKGKLKADDLIELELSYAPPFGSAKDPVNLLGYGVLNIMENLTDTIQWFEVKEKIASGALFLDVREKEEVKNGTIKGALNIPLDTLRNNLSELPKDKEIIVFCQVGLRGYIGERILKARGYKVKNLDGGYSLYKTAIKGETNDSI